MLRLLILLTLVFAVVLSLLAFVSTAIGHGMDTSATIALMRSQQSRNTAIIPSSVALFDLNHKLRADSAIPLEDMRQVAIDYSSFSSVFITTYSGDAKTRDYRAGFYEYNYLSHTLTPIDLVESDRQMNLNNGLFYSFSPMLTNEGQIVTFINPVDKKPYVFDRVLQQTKLLADVEISLMDAPNVINWSPDNTRVAIRDASELLIFNADGSNQLTYQLNSGDSFGSWSPDGQSIALVMQSMSSSVDKIDVIDAATGSEHPLTETLNGELNGWWGCDHQGIMYTSTIDDEKEGFLLNLETGETLRLNDDPTLESADIGSIIRLNGCQYLLLLNEQSFSLTQPTSQAMYVYDVDKQQVVLVDEMTTLSRFADDAIYYEKLDSTGSKRQLIKLTLDPLGEPVVQGEYEAVQAAWLNWSPEMRFATYQGLTGSSYLSGTLHVLDLASGQSHLLSNDNESVDLFTTFLWRDLECGELC